MVSIVYPQPDVYFNILIPPLHRVGTKEVVQRRPQVVVPSLTSASLLLADELSLVVAEDLSRVSRAWKNFLFQECSKFLGLPLRPWGRLRSIFKSDQLPPITIFFQWMMVGKDPLNRALTFPKAFMLRVVALNRLYLSALVRSRYKYGNRLHIF